jgi:amidohydrolase
MHVRQIIDHFMPNLDPYQEIYKDLHRFPELSCQESRTAAIAAEHLRCLNFVVSDRIGGNGIAGVFRNGPGPVVLLRAETDGLPILEKTGLQYASKAYMKDTDGIETPVMHACGHDMHVACLMAAATLLHAARHEWKGTLICIFQPNEERGGGAAAMVAAGLYSQGLIPIPNVVLGQHVVNIKSGMIATRSGPSLAGKKVFEVRVHGRGGHGSAPHECIDPVVIACYIVTRLQSVISRGIDPNEMAVVTCGSIHAGNAPNVIPDEAVLKVDIRAYIPEVLDKAVEFFRRIVAAECTASGVTRIPEIKEIECVPPLINNPDIVTPLTECFKKTFGNTRLEPMKLDTASDDFSLLAPSGIPYAYWNFGSTDHETWEKACDEGRLNDLPGNHSPLYAPEIVLTLRTGTEAMAVAALTFLTDGDTIVHESHKNSQEEV